MTSSFYSQIGNDLYGEAYDDFFGKVSLSSDGSVLAVGSPRSYNGGPASSHYGRGNVRIFTRVDNNWYETGRIEGDRDFWHAGNALSLSSDGSTLVINSESLVRIYKNVNNTWTQIGGDIDRGTTGSEYDSTVVSLSSDGSIVAIGSAGIWSRWSGSTDRGTVRIYENVNNSWTQIGSDIDGEAVGDMSGYSVSLSSDGSIVAIGAPKNDGNGIDSGHVRIYKNVNNTWTQVGSDIDGEANSDQSGFSVSLSADGSIVAIGAPYNATELVYGSYKFGHVRIYENVNNTWTQIGSDIDGGANRDRLGLSVSLSSDGSVVGVGAPDEYVGGTGEGHHGFAAIYQNINNR